MTDIEKLIAEIATDAANSVGGYARPGYATYDAAERAARAALEKAHTPTGDGRSSEQQVEQRDGDRGADHEEQQTDDLAATGGLHVSGHAESMAQAPSDGKRVISHTPTDDEREASAHERRVRLALHRSRDVDAIRAFNRLSAGRCVERDTRHFAHRVRPGADGAAT